jgi:O-antigen/teichoic acid export membrane protein
MNIWILIDHIIVSAARFGLSIMVARILGLEDFGIYSLIWTIWAFASALHVPALINPMMQLVPKAPSHRLPTLMWVIIFNQIAYSLFLALLITVAIIIFFGWSYETLLLCASVNSYVLIFNTYELIRRYLFVTKKEKLVLYLDVLAYLSILISVVVLYKYEAFSIATYFFISALPLTIIMIFFLAYLPQRKNISLFHKVYFKKTRNIFEPLLVSTLCTFISGHLFVYFTAYIIGTSEVGGISAMRHLTGPFLVLLLALENSVTRKSILLANVSGNELLNYMTSLRLFWVPAFSCLSAFMIIFAKNIIDITYGTEFIAFYELLFWMCLAIILQLLSKIQAIRLRAENKFYIIKKSNIMSMIVVVVATPFLISFYGMTGVGLCILLIAFSILFFQNWYDQRSIYIWR